MDEEPYPNFKNYLEFAMKDFAQSDRIEIAKFIGISDEV